MRNFTKVHVAQDARTELHDKLSLTGAEISVNNLPAGAGVPFVHSHKKNEEIYIILSGQGKADSAISFVCIQVQEHSLEEYTAEDAVIAE